jgi:hypothetical protein
MSQFKILLAARRQPMALPLKLAMPDSFERQKRGTDEFVPLL